MAQGMFPAGVVDQDPAHRLGGSAKEMGAAIPIRIFVSGQAQPGFMHQRRWLERVAGRFAGHFARGEPAQLPVNQRQQLIGGQGITVLDGMEQLRDLGHRIMQP